MAAFEAAEAEEDKLLVDTEVGLFPVSAGGVPLIAAGPTTVGIFDGIRLGLVGEPMPGLVMIGGACNCCTSELGLEDEVWRNWLLELILD